MKVQKRLYLIVCTDPRKVNLDFFRKIPDGAKTATSVIFFLVSLIVNLSQGKI